LLFANIEGKLCGLLYDFNEFLQKKKKYLISNRSLLRTPHRKPESTAREREREALFFFFFQTLALRGCLFRNGKTIEDFVVFVFH
jgi:hypothetical protein